MLAESGALFLDADDESPKFSDFFEFISVIARGTCGLIVLAKSKLNGNELSIVLVR